MCRLDEDDPVAAWQSRFDRLTEISERLSEHRFDAIHFSGDGTDLTVGLLPSSEWACASFATAEGISHHPNLPTEEVFTTPDPRRTEGVVRSTKPLNIEGTLVTGLTVRFEGGRAVAIDADGGAEVLRAALRETKARRGWASWRWWTARAASARWTRVFYSTLIDENAASHIALGNGLGRASRTR